METLSYYVDKKIVKVYIEWTTNKNMYLRYKDNKIVVQAPKRTSSKEIDSFVGENIERFASYDERTKENKLIDLKGNTVYLNGKKLSITTLTGFSKLNLKISGKKVYIESKLGTDEESEKAIKKYLKEYLNKYIENNLSKWEKKMDTKEHSFKTSYKVSTWGENHMNKNLLKFSERLSHYSDEVIDAIIVHELSHDFIPNHSKDFYNIVNNYKPDYKKVVEQLKADKAMTLE